MEFWIQRNETVVPHKRHWQFCVGSGRAHLALRTDYTRQLAFIHDTLGIQRVRFHGIFNDDMCTRTNLSQLYQVEGANEFQEVNFHACGVAYDNVLAAGMKPFVELSFMPDSLADSDRHGVFFYSPNICMPADMEAWREYIQKFIRYLLHRYGAEEVRTWFFEVWNEPDIQVVFSMESAMTISVCMKRRCVRSRMSTQLCASAARPRAVANGFRRSCSSAKRIRCPLIS